MGAASGIPGIVTTPTPPEGPASSLIAMGPLARTMIGSSARDRQHRAGHHGPRNSSPGVPVAIGWSPAGVTAYAV